MIAETMTALDIHITAIGALISIAIAASISATLWWMLHPPSSFVQKLAREAEDELVRMVGSIIVVFSPEILSGHMMALAAKLAYRERSELLAIYVIEVPYTLPPDADMPFEERAALDALGAAETIAVKTGITLRTETIKTRSTKQSVLDIAKREKANLIVLGSFREGKYSGAPLGRIIEEIAADAKCDVLIGVEGKHGTLLIDEVAQPTATTPPRTPRAR
ncbi:MAG TPA: universal stress protein [Candidatus Baltobacteraceae bacterium]|nr:universal stress protein [Candidatus Baltobacteraceae bacterium]